MTSSVTVSITRHVDPEQADRMVAWINAGASLAERFEGFLGTGWVRPSMDSHQWHMLYRFDSDAALDRWEESDQRRWWLQSAQGIAGAGVVERRTGIEGWFDDPVSTDVADLRPGPPAPPRWKQGSVIWMAFFPLSLLATWLLSLVLPDDVALPLRVLLSTLILTPIMTYVALPTLTSWMSWWLQGEPPPWRKDR
ncbi:MAG: antibiotic biosynthesis monooxygenase [Ornithinimicrobium sp.]|uniref:antibiotic biosynthesis monooxygenase n=1 Tax=Ornithinimicrobium sp. TaxID=1977084 RepID=UPI003D9B2665